MSMNTSIKTIDEYISGHPEDIQAKLQELRQAIRNVAPEASEKISYGLATFAYNGNLVHFGAYDTHIGFYPGAGAIVEFAGSLKPYDTSKGTVRFPIDKPLPLDLVRKITTYRVDQNRQKKK